MRNIYFYLIIGVVVLGVVILFGAAEAKDFTTGQMASLAFLGFALFLIFGRGGVKNLFKGRAGLEAIGLWLGIIALLAVIYTFKDDMQRAGIRVVNSFTGKGTQVGTGSRVELFKSGTHFTAQVHVNNKAEINMMVDTGASLIALSYEDAERLGIPVELLVYDGVSETANGKALSARLTLDMVRIGGIELTRVRASISQKGAMRGSLLGMSFMERLQSYSVEEGVMILKGK